MGVYKISPIKVASFLRNAQVKVGDPNGDHTTVGQNKKQKFAASHQVIRPRFSESKGVWLVDINEKDLNKIVLDLSFTHDEGNKKGEEITTSNLRNRKDAFFNHSELFLQLEEGETTIDTKSSMDRLFYAMMKADPEFKTSGSFNPAFSAIVRYKVEEFGQEDRVTVVEIDKEIEAGNRLKEMSNEHRLTIAKSMGRRVPADQPNALYKELYRLITKDAQVINSHGKRNLDHFMELATMDTALAEVRSIVADARAKGYIKKVGRSYTYGDMPLGNTLEEVYEFLEKSANNDVFNALSGLLK
jgi:hypothetical protein